MKAVADEFSLTHQRISQILGKTGEKRGSNTEVDWTPDLIKRLRREWKTGHSAAEIGRRLSVSEECRHWKGGPSRSAGATIQPISPKGQGNTRTPNANRAE